MKIFPDLSQRNFAASVRSKHQFGFRLVQWTSEPVRLQSWAIDPPRTSRRTLITLTSAINYEVGRQMNSTSPESRAAQRMSGKRAGFSQDSLGSNPGLQLSRIWLLQHEGKVVATMGKKGKLTLKTRPRDMEEAKLTNSSLDEVGDELKDYLVS
ncbi:uncharacterized protein LOC144181558 [Stigmatopora nigra]